MFRITRPRRRFRLPAHATVVAYLALFLVMSTGGAYAASKIGASSIKSNAIRSRHILNGEVRNPDLRAKAVTNSKLGANAVTTSKLKDGSVNTGDLADNAVNGAKVADDSVTGWDVNESTLGQVPSAANSATLAGKAPTAFASSTVYKRESAVDAGIRKGDATNVKSQSCDTGDILLSGGPANISKTSKMLESFPSPGTTNGWSARINDGGVADNFSVVVLCLDQTP
jgi:hypothetical protein